mgnify:CR=1 FL=1
MRRRLNVFLFLFLAAGCSGEPVLTDADFLKAEWESYRSTYIHREGYVFDPHNNGGEVTSEGQSYALLRAVWMDDEQTFTRVFRWTEEILRRPDGMYAWQWHPEDGTKDANTATDADQDIALALILAAHHFDKPKYLDRAREIIVAVREHTGIKAGEGWFPSAGNWAVDDRVINLSYFMPYSYPLFDRLDPEGDWPGVIETGYDLIDQARALPGATLLPDFMELDEDGKVEPVAEYRGLSGDFSFDAMRIHWRVALDCRLNKRPRACADPAGTRELARLLDANGKIVLRYTTDAIPLSHTESLSFYGSLLPAFEQLAPEAAARIREKELSPRVLKHLMKKKNRYYDRNWVWFGFAASSGLIESKMPH